MPDINTVVVTPTVQVVAVNNSVPGSFEQVADYLTLNVLPDQRVNAQSFLAKLQRNTEDVKLMVVGDSVSTGSTYWFYQFVQQFMALWPTHTVTYAAWDTGTGDYAAPTTFQTGTGSQTLAVYQCTFPGATTDDWVADRFSNGIAEIQPDFVFTCLGHNETNSVAGEPYWLQSYLALTASIEEACPFAALCVVTQNPETGVDYQQIRARMYGEIAKANGYGFLDITQLFDDNGGAAALNQVDGIHPNPTGVALWVAQALLSMRWREDTAFLATSLPGMHGGDDLLEGDGTFTRWTRPAPEAPDGWTRTSSNLACSQDTTNFESANGYSLKLTQSASGFEAVTRDMAVERCKGRWLTLLARMRRDAGQHTTTGRIALYDGTTSYLSRPIATAGNPLVFRWLIVQAFIPLTASVARVYLYGSNNAAAATASFDRVHCFAGIRPQIRGNGYPDLTKQIVARRAIVADHAVALSEMAIMGSPGFSANADITATLPTAVGINGQRFTIGHIDTSGYAVTVGTTSGQTIGNIPSLTTWPMKSKGQSLTVQSNGVNWDIAGAAFAERQVAVTAGDYTCRFLDRYILQTQAAAGSTVTLPDPAAGRGQVITVKKANATGFNITISPFSGENIEGTTSYVLSATNQSVSLISDGTNWWVVD